MLNAEILEKGPPPKIALEGVIDETTDLKALLGSTEPLLHLNCRKVSRINSVGVKLWREYFDDLRKSGRKVRFFELAPVLVSTRNYLISFIAEEELESVCVPYLCDHCNSVTVNVASLQEIRSNASALGSAKCAKCGQAAEMDELPEEYFSSILNAGG